MKVIISKTKVFHYIYVLDFKVEKKFLAARRLKKSIQRVVVSSYKIGNFCNIDFREKITFKKVLYGEKLLTLHEENLMSDKQGGFKK